MSDRYVRRCVVLAGVLVGFASQSAKPTCSDKELDAEAAFHKLAERGEVHAIGLSRPAVEQFTAADVRDWLKLIASLRARQGPAARVYELLAKETQKRIDADGILDQIGAKEPPFGLEPASVGELRDSLSVWLNTIILSRPDFYQEKSFKNTALTTSAKKLIALGKNRTYYQTACMNWELMHCAFPSAIPETNPRFLTIRANVKAGADVVLVLSCYNHCYWEVAVEPGAKISGVVLGGYHQQELKLTGVSDQPPVLYRAYYNLDGEVRRGKEFFYGYDRKQEKTWKLFTEDVKKATGKELTTFQGGSMPGPKDEPYMIQPLKK